MAKYDLDNLSVGDRVNLNNGAVAKVVQKRYKSNKSNKKAGRVGNTYKALQIVSGASKNYLDSIRDTSGPRFRGVTSRRPVSPKVAAKLLREAHLRRADGDKKKATRSMRADMSRIANKKLLTAGTPESARFRSKTGPLRYDIRGVDAGNPSKLKGSLYKRGVRTRASPYSPRGKYGRIAKSAMADEVSPELFGGARRIGEGPTFAGRTVAQGGCIGYEREDCNAPCRWVGKSCRNQVTSKVMASPKRSASGKAAAKKNPWLAHLNKVRAANPGMSYKEAMQLAKTSYTKKGQEGGSKAAFMRYWQNRMN